VKHKIHQAEENIVTQTKANLSPSQVFERLKVRAGLDAAEFDGTLQVSIIKADDLLNKDGGRFSGESDPYVLILVDDTVIAQTTVKNGLKVVWKEYFEKELKGKFDFITLRVLDQDFRSSDFLGEVRFSAHDVVKKKVFKGPSTLQTRLIKTGDTATPEDFKVAGTLDYLLEYRPKTLDGHLKVVVEKANGVKSSDWGGKGDPYVCVLLDSHLLGQTKVIKNTIDPVYNETLNFDVSGDYSTLFLSVWDSDIGKDDYISHLSIPTKEILEKKNIAGTLPLYQQATPEATPVALGSLTFSLAWTFPNLLGKVDIKFLKGSDLLNTDVLGARSKPDPYAEVLLDGHCVGKTKVINNNANPEWNETVSFQGKGQHQSLEIVIWDKDILRDDPLGKLRLPIADIVHRKQLSGDLVLGPHMHSPGAGSVNLQLVFTPQ
jgi:Ca2+-dependent lipid-binding protein